MGRVIGGMLLLSGFAAAQPLDYRIVSEVRLVVLDVGVRDRTGRAVAGLGRDAFRVFHSGRETSLAAFASEDAPVTIRLVVDTSASMRAKRRDVVSAAGIFVRESNPADEVLLVTFNDEVAVSPPASQTAVAGALESVVMDGRTALFDGMDAGLRQIEKGVRERKALIVISDGADNASRLSRSEILRRARSAHVTIYSIGMFEESMHDADPGFLREIAQSTGGDARLDVRPDQLASVCREIAREIRSRYMLAFRAAEARKEERRPIRVVVSAPHLDRVRVLSRRSYVAAPSPGAFP